MVLTAHLCTPNDACQATGVIICDCSIFSVVAVDSTVHCKGPLFLPIWKHYVTSVLLMQAHLHVWPNEVATLIKYSPNATSHPQAYMQLKNLPKNGHDYRFNCD